MKVEIEGMLKNEILYIKDEHNCIELWPSQGGILNSWHIEHKSHSGSIISGYINQDDFEAACEIKGFKSCKLSPYVCRVNDSLYEHKGEILSIGKFGFDRHNIHGLIYDKSYNIKEVFQDNDEARVILETIYDNRNEGFPFKYSIEIIYTLKKENELTIQSNIINLSNEIMPLCDGWHPYFNFGKSIDNYLLKINSDKKLEFDNELIPTGKLIDFSDYSEMKIIDDTFFDNCFKLNNSSGTACELIDPESGISLKLFNDKNYPYLQLFTPDDRNSIAIEPLSAAPDAFNNKIGLIELEPGKSVEFVCRWVWGIS